MTLLEHVDARLEDRSRSVASSTTRRGILNRCGKLALVLGGVTVAEGIGAGRAEAHHFCGHTGTSPSCANQGSCSPYRAQGGCWTACCGGRRRKICDCCVSGGSNRGYCPSGMSVICVRKIETGTRC